METVENIARAAGAVEVQATYDDQRPDTWSVSITTYAHGVPVEPGSMTGTGRGEGHTLDEATARAAEHYHQPNPAPEV